MVKLKCLMFGHKKYSPKALENADLMSVHDSLGVKLVGVNICERCGRVYSDLLIDVTKQT